MACGVIFTQMTTNAVFIFFGQPALAAMIKEFTQLNEGAVSGKSAIRPIGTASLSPLEKKKAMPAVN